MTNSLQAPPFDARDPDWAAKVRASFPRQAMMMTLGARLLTLEPGFVQIEMPFSDAFVQQHGYLHSGATTSIGDSAGGYACYSLMPANSAILTVEFKVNLLAPGKGDRFVASGRVIKPGRRLYVSEFEVVAFEGDKQRVCLHGMQTNMRLEASDKLPVG